MSKPNELLADERWRDDLLVFYTGADHPDDVFSFVAGGPSFETAKLVVLYNATDDYRLMMDQIYEREPSEPDWRWCCTIELASSEFLEKKADPKVPACIAISEDSMSKLLYGFRSMADGREFFETYFAGHKLRWL